MTFEHVQRLAELLEYADHRSTCWEKRRHETQERGCDCGYTEAKLDASSATARLEALSQVEAIVAESAPWEAEDVYPGDWDSYDRGEWWGEQLWRMRAALSQAQQPEPS